MKKLLTSIAAAAVLFSNTGCSVVHQNIEAQQQKQVQNALDDILQSVVCLRTTAKYQNSEGGEREQTVYGTGFVYKHDDGWFYVATNSHVGKMPDIDVDPPLFGIGKKMVWKKVGENVSIVENRFDDDDRDNVTLEAVRGSEELDTLVLRTKTSLHVARSYRLSTLQEQTADTVYVTGIPLAFEKGVVEGTVFNPQVELQGRQYTMLDITIQPGHSGSPVFVKGSDNQFYLVGQVRMCMPAAWGICGGFGLATEMSELNNIWGIDQKEPLPPPVKK